MSEILSGLITHSNLYCLLHRVGLKYTSYSIKMGVQFLHHSFPGQGLMSFSVLERMRFSVEKARDRQVKKKKGESETNIANTHLVLNPISSPGGKNGT